MVKAVDRAGIGGLEIKMFSFGHTEFEMMLDTQEVMSST